MNTKSSWFALLVILLLLSGFIGFILYEPPPRFVDNNEMGIIEDDHGLETKYLIGADLSTYDLIEEHNASYYVVSFRVSDPLSALQSAGFRLVRLRVWNDDGSNYSLDNALSIALKALEHEYQVMIDFHFSDTWADPGHQSLPSSWANDSFEELVQDVFNYVNKSLSYLGEHGVLPSFVQLGNEISCGFLWDYGRVCGDYDNETQWERFAELLKAGVSAVNAFSEKYGANTSVVIHTDLVKDLSRAIDFYGKLIDLGVDFDVIGLSYYPWWHGDVDTLNTTLNGLWENFSKPLMIVETAYPWTLTWCDDCHNIVGEENQLLPDFPATVEGQKKFLQAIIQVFDSLPDGAVTGMIYWEPAWVCVDGMGSPWENLALFDFNHKLLDSAYFYLDLIYS